MEHNILVAVLLSGDSSSVKHYHRLATLITGGDNYMPLFMEIYKGVDGLTAEAVIEAHKKDLETQGEHGVKCLRYWFNEDDGTVFCLFEAPNKEAGAIVHRKAHGLVADEIIEAKEGD